MIQVKTERSPGSRALALGFLLVALLAVGLLLTARSAPAATTFTVTSTGDGNDTNLGDGLCDGLPVPGNQCTLRAALQQAHVLPGADTINFNIPGGGVKTIKPGSALPKIRHEVTIDGYTQPGASENTLAAGTNAVLKIELDGEGRDFEGLWIITSDSVVRGLVINRFDHIGISIGPSGSGNKIQGNFIGTDPSGTLDRGNESRGVVVYNNGDEGTSGNTIGGNTPAARNLISGNDAGGVGIFSATDNGIKGNLIGTEKDGTSPLGNSGSGMRIHNSGFFNDESNNTVGGNTSEDANTIAFNHGDGVTLQAGDTNTGNRILRNSIFSNIDLFPDGLGIDLGDDGPTPNDSGDADAGPNNLQNFPVLSSAENSGGETTIRGTLNSTPNETFTIRFFSNPPGSSEGKKFIGQKNVTTNANGNTGVFTFKPAKKISVGQNITATATSQTGDTSEFSALEEV